jgi:hypothetical protein
VGWERPRFSALPRPLSPTSGAMVREHARCCSGVPAVSFSSGGWSLLKELPLLGCSCGALASGVLHCHPGGHRWEMGLGGRSRIASSTFDPLVVMRQPSGTPGDPCSPSRRWGEDRTRGVMPGPEW